MDAFNFFNDLSVSENSIEKNIEIFAESGEDITTADIEESIPADADTVRFTINIHNPDYMELLEHINSQLAEISQQLSENTVSGNTADIPYVPTVSENNITVTVSENSIEPIENALISTKLTDYSLTDSLLLIIVFILLIGNILTFVFMKGGRK